MCRPLAKKCSLYKRAGSDRTLPDEPRRRCLCEAYFAQAFFVARLLVERAAQGGEKQRKL